MLRFHIIKRGIPRGFVRLVKDACHAALVNIAKGWQRDTLPKHFTWQAARQWNYWKRQPKYMAWKRRKNLPFLVLSGQGRRDILGDHRQPKGERMVVTVRMEAPRYFHIKNPGWPWRLRDEVTAVTDKEVDAMAGEVDRQVQRQIAAIKDVEHIHG